MKCPHCQADSDRRRLRSIDRGQNVVLFALGLLTCIAITTAAMLLIVGAKVKSIDAAIVAEK